MIPWGAAFAAAGAADAEPGAAAEVAVAAEAVEVVVMTGVAIERDAVPCQAAERGWSVNFVRWAWRDER